MEQGREYHNKGTFLSRNMIFVAEIWPYIQYHLKFVELLNLTVMAT